MPHGSPHFLKAVTAAARIQLEHKQDAAAYVACYSQLAEQSDDHELYRLLGAALLRVHEPEQAIKVLHAHLSPACLTGAFRLLQVWSCCCVKHICLTAVVLTETLPMKEVYVSNQVLTVRKSRESHSLIAHTHLQSVQSCTW